MTLMLGKGLKVSPYFLDWAR